MKEVEVLHRFLIVDSGYTDFLAALEWTADKVWLSKSKECDRATIRGVPAKRLDVLVDVKIRQNAVDSRDKICVEVSNKTGRFDGAVRPRISIYVVDGRDKNFHNLSSTDVSVEFVDDRRYVQVKIGPWAVIEAVLRSGMDNYNLARIVMWHWNRYYKFIPEPDARALADSWAAEVTVSSLPTLAEANRAASRQLYRLARDMGWHKLTERDRNRLGLTGQWVCDSEYLEAQNRIKLAISPAVGEATSLASYCEDSARVIESWEE